ncbi:MAG: hypothetical protein AAGK32_02420, partial [Actinomycetota bacterium]
RASRRWRRRWARPGRGTWPSGHSSCTAWPRADVALSYDDPGAWSYPGLGLAFSDGTSSMVFGEKRWGLDVITAAAEG